MKRLQKVLWVGALLAGVAILALPSQARADYAVRVIDDGVTFNDTNHGGTIGVLVVGNSLVFTGSTTHFSITNGSSLSNNPGTQGGSNLDLSSNQQITTTFGATGGSHTITILVSQTGWATPTGNPLTLSSSAGGSIAYLQGTNLSATQTVAASYQGFLDNTNSLFGTPVAGSTPLQNASATRNSVGTSGLVFSPDPAVNNLVPGGTPFSMTDVMSFTFTLSAGSGQDTANIAASTVASVPAPAGVVLALAGLPCLGVGAWLKRRRQTVAATV